MDSSAIRNSSNKIMKLVLGDEIRALPRAPKLMDELNLFVKKTFPNKIKNSFTLSYKDEDGDRINLDIQEDLDALYELSSDKTSYKIEVSPVDEEYEIIKKLEDPEVLSKSEVMQTKEIPSPSIFKESSNKTFKDEIKLYSFSLVRPIKLLPEKVTTTSADFIYAPISIKNTGMLDFPYDLKFVNVSESIKGESIALPGLKVGEQTIVSLVMDNPKIAGEYFAYWELKNQEITVGNLVFNIEIGSNDQANERKYCFGVKKCEKAQKSVYRSDVTENAKKVQNIFGGDLQKYQELIQSKNFTHLDAIIDEILEQNKAIELFQKKF